MAISRQKQQVFNKPVGVVRAQPKTATAETWQSISELSQSLSAMVYKQASAEAEMAGIKKSMEVDVLDESGNITKAPVNMGSIGTKAFEKNMMQRYENKMRLMIDNKVTESLAKNPNDSDDFNTSASIAVGALIDNADPTFQGVLKDYASAKISAGNNTVLRNRNQIDSQERVAETITMTDQMANQAVNAYLAGNNRLAEDLEARIERAWTDLRSDGDATAGQSQDRINAYRRNILTSRIGMSLRDMSSSEIQSAIDAFNKGTLKDIVDTDRMQKAGVSYEGIKNLITLHPHIADDLVIGRTMSNVEQDQSKVESDQQANLDNINFQKKLNSGQRVNIGTKEMASYSQYAFSVAGLEFNANPTAEEITQLANSKEFLTVLAQQQKLPDAIKFKLEDMVNGIMGDDPDKAIALMEFYQSLENNVSITGVPRDITSAVGLDGELRTKLQGISKLLTFNNTPEGLAQILALANVPENDRISRAMTNINDKLKPQNPITTYAGARGFVFNKLRKEFDDNEIAEEVVDETLMLMNLLPAKEAMNVVTSTVKQKWKDSQYTVDFKSGGTAIRTRFAPETIFGEGTKVLQDFEQAVVDKSGVVDAELGKNVFVMVDPNSSNQNVRYYLMKGKEGISGIEPIIKDGKLVSIELLEYADDMQEQYQNVLLENLSYASQIAKIVKDAEDYIFVQQPIVNIDSSSVQEMYEGLK
jgi:hypothetical protein